MHCIYVPIKKPEILGSSKKSLVQHEERISIKCFQTIVEYSSSCLYFLHNGLEGQMKCIKNSCKKKDITINTYGFSFEIEKKTSIILIYISKNKGWTKIYET